MSIERGTFISDAYDESTYEDLGILAYEVLQDILVLEKQIMILESSRVIRIDRCEEIILSQIKVNQKVQEVIELLQRKIYQGNSQTRSGSKQYSLLEIADLMNQEINKKLSRGRRHTQEWNKLEEILEPFTAEGLEIWGIWGIPGNIYLNRPDVYLDNITRRLKTITTKLQNTCDVKLNRRDIVSLKKAVSKMMK